jgi:preprotein translocase subunit SecD
MAQFMFRSLFGLIFNLTLSSACFAESVVLDVLSVAPSHDSRTGRPIVQLVLGQKSKQALTAFSSAEIGNKAELRVDGRVVAAPVIREPLSTSIQISDVDWTDEVAAAIANDLAKPNAKIELGTIKE